MQLKIVDKRAQGPNRYSVRMERPGGKVDFYFEVAGKTAQLIGMSTSIGSRESSSTSPNELYLTVVTLMKQSCGS
jgi:hypothetical protein